MFDDPMLEKKLVVSGALGYQWRELRFGFDASVGGVWNRLALRTVEGSNPYNNERFYSPSNENAFLLKLGLSCEWKPSIMAPSEGDAAP
jgi:hypothetical protein